MCRIEKKIFFRTWLRQLNPWWWLGVIKQVEEGVLERYFSLYVVITHQGSPAEPEISKWLNFLTHFFWLKIVIYRELKKAIFRPYSKNTKFTVLDLNTQRVGIKNNMESSKKIKKNYEDPYIWPMLWPITDHN